MSCASESEFDMDRETDNKRRPRVGIIGADEMEIALLKEAAADTACTALAGMNFCEGHIGNTDVVIAQCGIGKVNAAICTELLIGRYHVEKIINTGVAGSLNAGINIGDLVISTDAVHHDFDISPLGYGYGEIPYLGVTAFPADEELRAAAVRAARTAAPELGVFEGRICSGDQFIASSAQKEQIRSRVGGMCCEMEGAAIAQVCYLNRIPWVAIRAISDKADETGDVDYPSFAAKAARDCAGIVRAMLEALGA